MGKQRQGAVVLLICDSHELCPVAAPLLKKTGYRVVEASAGEAHAQALAHRADLILLDLSVPETALAVVQQLKGDPTTEAIPLLQLTAPEHAAQLAAAVSALTQLHALSTRVLEAEGTEALLQEILDTAIAIVGADKGTLQLREGETLRILAQRGHDQRFLEFFASAEGVASVCGEATRQGERVVVPDVESCPLLVGTPSLEVLREAEVRAVQSTPLVRRDGSPLGVLTTQWSAPYAPNERDLWRLDLLARQASDLIERAGTAEALRESEARFRAFVTASSDVVYRMSPDWREMRYLQGREFLADTLDPSRSWLEKYIYPDDRPHVLAVIQEAIRTKRVFELEHRVVRADGTLGWTFSRAIPLLDEQGEILEWFGTASDITARKEAEESLRQLTEELEQRVAERAAEVRASEARWQGVVEGIADEVWLADAEGRMTLLNLPTVTAMGLEEFAGKPIEEVLREVEILRPDGSVRPPEESPLLRSLHGEIVRGEEIMRHRRTGTTRYRQYSSAPTREADGTITGAVAIVRDVTQQKRTEEERERLFVELEAVLQQMPAGVVIANRSGRVVRVNRQAEELSGGGITIDAQVGRYPRLRAFRSDGSELGEGDWQSTRALRTGEAVPPEEMVMERPDGSRSTVLASSSPLRNRDGRLAGVVVVFYDVSERRQAEEERKHLQEQLLEAERARADIAERMTAEINHRMKNNLALLSGVLEVQAMDLPQGAAARHAIRDATTRLTALSAIHEQLYEARSARVDLRSVLRRIAEMDVQALAIGEVLLRVGGDATSIPSKLGSTLALIGNELISNALQYGALAESGRLEIEVLVSRSSDGLHLRVWNSGHPVAEGFDASAQTGIGLPLVHDVIVRQLHGDFALRPDRGGTAAEVFVPEREIQEAEFVPVGEGRATPSV